MSAYYDSSAFLKLVLDEPGTPVVQRLWDRYRPVSSVALVAEARAALGKAVRGGRVDVEERDRALLSLRERLQDVETMDVDLLLAERAGELADRCSVRGYDAIHLASAEALLEVGDVMVCADRRLARAAEAIGLEAVVPGAAA